MQGLLSLRLCVNECDYHPILPDLCVLAIRGRLGHFLQHAEDLCVDDGEGLVGVPGHKQTGQTGSLLQRPCHPFTLQLKLSNRSELGGELCYKEPYKHQLFNKVISP